MDSTFSHSWVPSAPKILFSYLRQRGGGGVRDCDTYTIPRCHNFEQKNTVSQGSNLIIDRYVYFVIIKSQICIFTITIFYIFCFLIMTCLGQIQYYSKTLRFCSIPSHISNIKSSLLLQQLRLLLFFWESSHSGVRKWKTGKTV